MDKDQLKAWRKARGQSQVQAAEDLGVSRSTLIRWERGEPQQYAVLLALACEALERKPLQ